MKLFRKKQDKNKLDRWPMPEFDENDQPHFLFIITPPFSGSTALAQLINTSYRTMLLKPAGEGQRLVPGLCEKDRWNPEKEVNYLSVKATWLSKYQQVKRLTNNIDVVIEKSPPNMMRIKQLSSQFNDCSFIANNRDPYANCASILYRNHDADNLSPEKRQAVLINLVDKWIKRSAKIKELIVSLEAPILTYEEFCENPSSVINKLKTPSIVSDSINLDANVNVKDYAPQPIINQNQRQISKLTDKDIKHISNLLRPNNELAEYFGYKIFDS